MRSRRVERVRGWLAEQELGALLVSSAPNVRWLTGFAGEGMLVVDDGTLICTDSRYRVQSCEEAPGIECAAEGGHLEQAIARLEACGAARVGFEAPHLSYASWQKLAEGLGGVTLVPCGDEIRRLRAIKDAGEVKLIERAASVADEAFGRWRGALEPGITEREAALELERLMVLGGAEKPSFGTIMAAGTNGAKPHACPGRRTIDEGDLVVVDWGAQVDGYCSDCTRTLLVGEVGEQQRAIWQAVRAAQLAAIDAAVAGARCADVDAVAREVLRGHGWEKEFSHGLGHGVGLQVHEQPTLSQRSEDVLASGMVVTIEPGVYIDGWGGVRLEELILVTEEAPRVLTHAPYDL